MVNMVPFGLYFSIQTALANLQLWSRTSVTRLAESRVSLLQRFSTTRPHLSLESQVKMNSFNLP